MSEHPRLHVAPIAPEPNRPVDLIADPHVGDGLRAAGAHENRRGAGDTVEAGVKASSVWIDAEPEPDVGRVVLAEDRLRLLLEDLELRGRRLAEPFRVDGFPGVRGVGN